MPDPRIANQQPQQRPQRQGAQPQGQAQAQRQQANPMQQVQAEIKQMPRPQLEQTAMQLYSELMKIQQAQQSQAQGQQQTGGAPGGM